jgi:anti-sigma regulatory factor (Ser/Thr protein kinase)
MKVNIKNAISRFYPNPSFEQVYFEAVANAIDAGATHVSILVEIEAFDHPDTLSITITDDGDGFTDRNFDKFCSLLEVDNAEHRGLGRLVYLAYFNEIRVASRYEEKQRTFTVIP